MPTADVYDFVHVHTHLTLFALLCACQSEPAPLLVSASPGPGAVDVELETPLVLEFEAPVSQGDLRSVSVLYGDGLVATGDWQIDGPRATFRPDAGWFAGVRHQVDPGRLRDGAGPLGAWTFDSSGRWRVLESAELNAPAPINCGQAATPSGAVLPDGSYVWAAHASESELCFARWDGLGTFEEGSLYDHGLADLQAFPTQDRVIFAGKTFFDAAEDWIVLIDSDGTLILEQGTVQADAALVSLDVVVDRNENGAVAWIEASPTDYRVYVRRIVGGIVGEPELVTESPSSSVYFGSLRVRANREGQTVVVWNAYSTAASMIRAAWTTGNAPWQVQDIAQPGGEVETPLDWLDVAMDDAGWLYVVWTLGLDAWASAADGTGALGPTRLGTAYDEQSVIRPRLATNGVTTSAFWGYDYRELAHATAQGGAFGTSEVIELPVSEALELDAEIDPLGNRLLLAAGTPACLAGKISETWTSTCDLPGIQSTSGTKAGLSVGPRGRAFASWYRLADQVNRFPIAIFK